MSNVAPIDCTPLAAALRYAMLGYRVFPCVAGEKRPATRNGCKDATRDLEQIRCWWTEAPHANLAVATDGLVVVDVDGADNPWLADEPARAEDLFVAPASITPRGGRHHWFRQPAGKAWRCSASKLAPQVDVRAGGGYVVVPPSRVGGAGYAWIEGHALDRAIDALPEPPDWLCDQLDRLSMPTPASPTKPRAGRLVVTAESCVPIPERQRNTMLASIAGKLRRNGLNANEMLTVLSRVNRERCVPPLSDDEVERIADSISRYPSPPVRGAFSLVPGPTLCEDELPPSPLLTDPGPFPQSLLDVPGFLGEVVAHSVATGFRPQPVLALGAALALLGTLTGRSVCDEVGTRTNVYCIGVGPSGAGKERARQVNKEILLRAGAGELIGPEGIASHAGLVAAVEQQPAILFQLDEIGRLLKTLAEPSRAPHLYHIATNLMKLYTSSGSIYVGDAYADVARNKTIRQPHACVYGTTVGISLCDGLSAENVTDGFLSRVMLFESDMAPKQTPSREPIPERIVATARRWRSTAASSLTSEPRVIVADGDAFERFDAFDREAEAEVIAVGEPLGTLWTRAVEKARKLALLHACSRGPDVETIMRDDAEWGCALSAYLTRALSRKASGWVAENPFEAKRKRVLRLVADAGPSGMPRTDLYRKTRSFTSRERGEVLDSLLECRDIREVREPSGPQGGAPRVRYVAVGA